LGIPGTARGFEVDPNTVLHWLVEAADQLQALHPKSLVNAYLTVPKPQMPLAVLRKGLDAKVQPAYFGDTFWPSFQ